MKFCIFVLLITIVNSAYTRIDDAQEFNIIMGKSTNVALASNPSIGYSWLLKLPNSIKLKAADLKGEFKLLKGLAPGSGIQIFEISCSELCENDDAIALSFEYKRPWDVKPLKTKVITANIIANHEL